MNTPIFKSPEDYDLSNATFEVEVSFFEAREQEKRSIANERRSMNDRRIMDQTEAYYGVERRGK